MRNLYRMRSRYVQLNLRAWIAMIVIAGATALGVIALKPADNSDSSTSTPVVDADHSAPSAPQPTRDLTLPDDPTNANAPSSESPNHNMAPSEDDIRASLIRLFARLDDSGTGVVSNWSDSIIETERASQGVNSQREASLIEAIGDFYDPSIENALNEITCVESLCRVGLHRPTLGAGIRRIGGLLDGEGFKNHGFIYSIARPAQDSPDTWVVYCFRAPIAIHLGTSN